jgi:hypothetical protein
VCLLDREHRPAREVPELPGAYASITMLLSHLAGCSRVVSPPPPHRRAGRLVRPSGESPSGTIFVAGPAVRVLGSDAVRGHLPYCCASVLLCYCPRGRGRMSTHGRNGEMETWASCSVLPPVRGGADRVGWGASNWLWPQPWLEKSNQR